MWPLVVTSPGGGDKTPLDGGEITDAEDGDVSGVQGPLDEFSAPKEELSGVLGEDTEDGITLT